MHPSKSYSGRSALTLFLVFTWCVACNWGLQTAWSEDGLERGSAGNPKRRVEIEPQEQQAPEIDELKVDARLLRLRALLPQQRHRLQVPKSDRNPEVNQPQNTDESLPALFFFTATWCSPCQQINPLMERLRREGYQIRSVDVDKESELKKKYGVNALPFFLLLIDGKEADHNSGTASERRIREMLQLKQMRRERVRPVHTLHGSVEDRAKESSSPKGGIVSDAETWKALCEAWMVNDRSTQIDFARQIIIVETTHGSGVSLEFEKDCHGSLNYRGTHLADYRTDGFRYFIAVIDRSGIEAVNGKEIPELQTQNSPRSRR